MKQLKQLQRKHFHLIMTSDKFAVCSTHIVFIYIKKKKFCLHVITPCCLDYTFQPRESEVASSASGQRTQQVGQIFTSRHLDSKDARPLSASALLKCCPLVVPYAYATHTPDKKEKLLRWLVSVLGFLLYQLLCLLI